MHSVDAPDRWPSVWRWLGSARSNALDLFPKEAYTRLRLDRSIFGRSLVILSDPDAIAHVCGRASGKYRLSNLHLRMLRPALGEGLTVAQGRHWAVQRRLASRLMPRRHTDERTERIALRIDATLAAWSGAGPTPPTPVPATQLTDLLAALSIDLIAQSVFDYDCPVASEQVVAAVNRHRQVAERPDLLDAFGVDPRIGSPRMRQAQRIAHSLDDDIESAICDAAAQRRRRAPDSAQIEFSRDFVVSLITGFESVTVTTLWLLLICAVDRGLQARLHAAVVSHDPAEVSPESPALPSLLDACLAETLRLYPPLPLMFRVAAEDDETPAGPVRKGAMVCISPWLVQRHRALWDRPDVFDPERHRRGDASLRAYMPFGVGTRRCIGMHVGNLLVKAIVTRVLQTCEISTAAARLPRPRAGMSLRPEPTFELCFSPRG